MEEKKLSKLDYVKVESFIKTLKKPATLVKELADHLDLLITNDLSVSLQNFSSKTFSLDNKKEFKGPVWFLSKQIISELTESIKELSMYDLSKGLKYLGQEIVEAQKKAANSKGGSFQKSIGHQIMLQLILIECPNVFFMSFKNEKSAVEELFDYYQPFFANNNAIGHSLIWMCDQSKIQIGVKSQSRFVAEPMGLNVWLKYILPIFSSSEDCSGSVVKASLAYLDAILTGIEILTIGDKKIEVVEVSFSFLVLLAKTGGLKKNVDLLKNFKQLKSLLFGNSKIVATSISTADFKNLLKLIENESNDDILQQYVDVAIKVLSFDKSFVDFLTKEYPNHYSAVSHILTKLLQQAKTREKSDFIKISKNGLGSLLKTILKVNIKTRVKMTKGGKVSGKIMGPDEIDSINKLSRALYKKIATRSIFHSFFKFLIYAIFVTFVYYTVVHVACNKDEIECQSDECFYEPMGCLLEHPQVQKMTENYRNDILPINIKIKQKAAEYTNFAFDIYHEKVAPHLKAKSEWVITEYSTKIHQPWISPFLEKAEKHQIYINHVSPALKASQDWFNNIQIVQEIKEKGWKEKGKVIWKNSARFVVFHGYPRIRETSKQLGNVVLPHVENAASVLKENYRAKVEPFLETGIEKIKAGSDFILAKVAENVEKVKKDERWINFWNSEYGKKIDDFNQNYLSTGFNYWKKGVSGIKCVFGFGEGCENIPAERWNLIKKFFFKSD